MVDGTYDKASDDLLVRATRPERFERRFNQLLKQMESVNRNFDEIKFWNYGCHCLFIGDRPVPDMGHGVPLDSLDRTCKSYKECQKCVREKFGDTCTGEFYTYDVNFDLGYAVCRNKPNSCERGLCECDKMFSYSHDRVTHEYSSSLNHYTNTFDPNKRCILNNGGGSEPKCCSNLLMTKPFKLYNSLANECCSDGSVVFPGTCHL